MKFLFFLALLLLAQSGYGQSTVEQKRMMIVKKLKAQKYFLDESCPRVADDVLKKFGLPPLGRTKPVKGKRGKFSRPKKAQILPNLRDEITPQGSKSLKIHLQMQSLDKTRPPKWRIKVERRAKLALKKGPTAVALTTEFNFVSRTHKGHDSCELTSVAFKLKNNASDSPLKPETVNVRECLDLFLVKLNTASDEMTWLKGDCALALHYSSEAKAMAAKSK